MFPSCASFWLYLVQFCLYLRGIVISLMCNCHCHSFCFLCVLLSFVHCLLVGTSHYSSGPQLFHPIAEPTTLPLSSTPCRYCRRQSSQKGCCPPHGSLSCQDRSWSHNSQLWSNSSTIFQLENCKSSLANKLVEHIMHSKHMWQSLGAARPRRKLGAHCRM